jgi:hypothetical protein
VLLALDREILIILVMIVVFVGARGYGLPALVRFIQIGRSKPTTVTLDGIVGVVLRIYTQSIHLLLFLEFGGLVYMIAAPVIQLCMMPLTFFSNCICLNFALVEI